MSLRAIPRRWHQLTSPASRLRDTQVQKSQRRGGRETVPPSGRWVLQFGWRTCPALGIAKTLRDAERHTGNLNGKHWKALVRALTVPQGS